MNDFIKKGEISLFGIDDELKNNINSIYTTNIKSSKFPYITYSSLGTTTGTNITLPSALTSNTEILASGVRNNVSGVFNYDLNFNLTPYIYGSNATIEFDRARIFVKTNPVKLDTDYVNLHRNPLVWYRFESTATLGIDFMNNHNLTNTNTTIDTTNFKRGASSASFNGTTSILQKTNAFNFNNKSFSICLWVRKVNNGRNDYFFEIGTGNTANTTIMFGYRATNFLTFSNTNDDLDSIIALPFDAGNWVHLAITYETGTRKAIIYRNAVNIGQKNFTAEFNTNNTINIGKYGTGYYSGLMNDFRIYDYVITQEEVNLLYNNFYLDRSFPILKTAAGDIINPTHWYKFDDADLGKDTMGTMNLSPINNPTFNPDNYAKGNGSVYFYKPSFQYMIGSTPINYSNRSISVSFWMRRDGITIDSLWSIGSVGAQRQSMFGVYYNDSIIFGFYQDDTGGTITFGDNQIWVHFVMTYQTGTVGGITRRRRIYRNGELAFDGNAGGETTVNNVFWMVGSPLSNPLSGFMDDFRIYADRELTLAQVRELYLGRVEILQSRTNKEFYSANDGIRFIDNRIDNNTYITTARKEPFVKLNTKKYLFSLNNSIKQLRLTDKAKLIIKSIYIPNIISKSFLQSKATNNVILKMKGINNNIFNSGNSGYPVIFSTPLKVKTDGGGTRFTIGLNPDLLNLEDKPRIETDNNGILITNPDENNLFNYNINQDFIDNGSIELELVYDISTVFQNHIDMNTYNYIYETLDYNTDKDSLESFNINFIIKDIDNGNEMVYEEKQILNKINMLLLK